MTTSPTAPTPSEAHKDLARALHNFGEHDQLWVRKAAQLIAASEARACAKPESVVADRTRETVSALERACAEKDAEIGRLRAEAEELQKPCYSLRGQLQDHFAAAMLCGELTSATDVKYVVDLAHDVALVEINIGKAQIVQLTTQLEEGRGRVRRFRTMLERTMYWLGDQIAKKTLNESAADGTQTLSRDIASLLDVLAETAPRDDGGEKK